MITRSIVELKSRLLDAEDRLAIERRRREARPAVLHALTNEAAALREALWAERRARLQMQGATP